jgi:hypothetical protein
MTQHKPQNILYSGEATSHLSKQAYQPKTGKIYFNQINQEDKLLVDAFASETIIVFELFTQPFTMVRHRRS